jgi:hypothetical protein
MITCELRLHTFMSTSRAPATRWCCCQRAHRQSLCQQFPRAKLQKPRTVRAYAARMPGKGGRSTWEASIKFVDTHSVPLSLLTALTCGFCFPSAAAAAGKANIGVVATTVIFMLSGEFVQCRALHRTLQSALGHVFKTHNLPSTLPLNANVLCM